MSMLILIVAVAIAASFGMEMIVHRLKNTYEIEWPAPVVEPENVLALEIARRLRQNGQKPERQVNKAFKVASGVAW
jgi:hypothetical protein